MFLVHGSYFGYNFGDTLLCRIFTNYVREATNGAIISLPLANKNNLKYIGGDTNGISSLFNADGLVFCGGGYFSEKPGGGFKWALRAIVRHILLGKLAMFLGVKYAVIGVGVGPISNIFLRRLVIDLFNRAELIAVRDNESLEYLNSLGICKDIIVMPDAALNISSELGPANLRNENLGEGRKLLVHSSAFPSASELEVIKNTLNWAKNRPNLVVVLATDSKTRRKDSNWMHDSEIVPKEISSSVIKFVYDGEVESMCSLIRSVDCVVTTKLHVGIVSTSYEKYIVSCPSHPKTSRFYNQVGLSNNCFPNAADDFSPVSDSLDFWYSGGGLDFSGMWKCRKSMGYPDVVKKFINEI